jgi:RNA polymerase sigma-70 factor (ECF subfamily)
VASLRSPFALIVLSSVPEDKPPTPSRPVAIDQIEACRRGDRTALDAVFRAHAEGLARLLTRIVGPSVEVEDLLQETFAAAITAFPSFRGEASVKTWLHRIGVNVAHSYLRRPRHRKEVLVDENRESTIDVSPERREIARRLYEHLDSLDAKQRITLVLYVIEEHTVDEIAALVGAGKAATRSRILWARRKLMKRMKKDPVFANFDFGGKPR